MFLFSRSRRPRRAHEWNAGKAVTFIVTLAATGSVTLAARHAGMSRKSAYALKERDPAFAEAWKAAIGRRKGDKVEEVDEARFSPGPGDTPTRTGGCQLSRRAAEAQRDRLLARLAARNARTPPLRKLSL